MVLERISVNLTTVLWETRNWYVHNFKNEWVSESTLSTVSQEPIYCAQQHFSEWVQVECKTWSMIETFGSRSLVFSQPWVGHDSPEDRSQVAKCNKDVINGGGQVFVPVQEVREVQHQDSCGRTGPFINSLSLFLPVMSSQNTAYQFKQ